MHVADSRGLNGFFLPIRHEDYDNPPVTARPWDLALRVAHLGCVVRDRLDSVKNEQTGKYLIELEDVGDFTGSILWPRTTRGLNTIREVFPTQVVAKPKAGTPNTGLFTFGRGGDVEAHIIRKPWERDDRLKALVTDQPNYLPRPPGGWLGVVVSAQDERNQNELWYSTDPRLCAPDRGGSKDYGSIVCDMRGDDADTEVAARLQTHERVTHIEGQYQIAWMGTEAKQGKGGFGVWYGKGDGAAQATSPGVANWASWERRGPLHSGHHSNDKHKVGNNAEGESEQPLHIGIGPARGAFYYKNRVEDGRLDHTAYVQGGFTGQPRQTRFGYDFATGLHRWWHRDPLIEPPEPPPPPVENPPWQQWPPPIPPGMPLEPQTDKPLQPGLYEKQLAAPSFQLTSGRDRSSQPGDGRFGGGGQDTIFDQSPDPGSTKSILDRLFPLDMDTPPEDISGMPFDLSGVEPITDGSGLAPTSPELGFTYPDPGPGVENEFTHRRQRREEYERQQGRSGWLSQAAKDRGGPSPLTVEMVGLAKVQGGHWLYQSRPGEHWGNGTAETAAMVIAPGGWLHDGPDSQGDWLGSLAVLLYAGDNGGSAVTFGWGEWSQTSGDWSDGAVFGLSDSSGSRNLNLAFRDASGSARDGTLQFNGTQVLTTRRTGWEAPSGTAVRTTFDADSPTISPGDVAQRLKALIDDLTTHGVIGA